MFREHYREVRQRLTSPAIWRPDAGINLRRPQGRKGDSSFHRNAPIPTVFIYPWLSDLTDYNEQLRALFLRVNWPYIQQQSTEQVDISIKEIQSAICRFFGISRNDLLSGRRTAAVIRPRHLAIGLARHLTTLSLPAIGRAFGNRDHTTILHACRKSAHLIEAVAAQMAADASAMDWVRTIEAASG